MKLFKKKKEGQVVFEIPEDSRNWIEENLRWLCDNFGYLESNDKQFLFDYESFPESFSKGLNNPKAIIKDLAFLLELDEHNIQIETINSLEGIQQLPKEIVEGLFNSQTIALEDSYIIQFDANLPKYPNRLLFQLILEMVGIRMTENQMDWDTGDDTKSILHLAGLYFGFGFILLKNIKEKGFISEREWDTNWQFISGVPEYVMTFGLATFEMLTENTNPVYLKDLDERLQLSFEKAGEYIAEQPSEIINLNLMHINGLLHQGIEKALQNKFDQAIDTFKEMIEQSEDDHYTSYGMNNIGYNLTRLLKYEESIPYFEQAIQLNPKFAYPYDNLGYALIQLGKLEEGKEYIESAIEIDGNDDAYSYRNLALYYMAKDDVEQAENYFQMAFNTITVPVDLLEYHYSRFLCKVGRIEEAKEFMQISLDKREFETINELKNLGL